MPTIPMNQVIHHLRRAVLARDVDRMTDGQLLECFIADESEAAFAALVRRHGPMVLGVCRRMLAHHDAEDAFQATFLVLVRKATSIKPRAQVSNWLYGVAYHTTLKARTVAMKRRGKEQQLIDTPAPEAKECRWRDLQTLLDEEMTCLPEKFRVPLVLCDLEGNETLKSRIGYLRPQTR